MAQPDTVQGLVVAAHGRHYMVELADGTVRQCFPRRKRSEAAVGDQVIVTPAGADEGTIEKILERRNLLYRSDEMRTKQFAANVDQLLIVVATEPAFSDDLTGRALVAARTSGIAPIIVLNKADMTTKLADARERLRWAIDLEVPVIELVAVDENATRDTLLPVLDGKCNLLLGQSAMGKSTILNALVPNAQAATQEHSRALGAGKHTTTTTRLYHLPEPYQGSIIDSPGFQSFGLHHLDDDDIRYGFPEFSMTPQPCRFSDCSHRHEPGCSVQELLEAGKIAPQRYALYTRLLQEHEAKNPW